MDEGRQIEQPDQESAKAKAGPLDRDRAGPRRLGSASPRPEGLTARIAQSLEDRIWVEQHESARGLEGFFWRWVQIFDVAARGFIRHSCTLRSSALTYATVLSFVPLLAVAFSILKGQDIQHQVAKLIMDSFFAGSEEAVREAIDKVVSFIDNTQTIQLGTLGGIALVLIGLSVLINIERALNSIWEIRRGRSMYQRAMGYAALVFFVPILLASGATVTALLGASQSDQEKAVSVEATGEPGGDDDQASPQANASVEPPEPVSQAASELEIENEAQPPPVVESEVPSGGEDAGATSKGVLIQVVVDLLNNVLLRPLLALLPYMAIWLVFFWIYHNVPNTQVRWRSSLIAGLIGGTIWQLAQASYIQYSIHFAGNRYNLIYGTFAWPLILLVWIYLSWFVLLFGAEISCAHQNLDDRRRRKRIWHGTPAEKETLGLRLATMLARPMLSSLGQPFEPMTVDQLADRLRLSPQPIEETLELFNRAGLVARSDKDGGYIFCRSPHEIGVRDILHLLRHGTFTGTLEGSGLNESDALPGVLDDAGAKLKEALDRRSLTDLAALPLERVRTFTLD